jgi:hypothetical protein
LPPQFGGRDARPDREASAVRLIRFPTVAPSVVRLSRLACLALASPATARPQDPAHADSAIVRAIEIRRDPVFEAHEARFWGYRLANALHADTRAFVIRRELLFAAGEPYDTARVKESERNLRALGFFRAVEIDSVRTDSGLIVRVRTADAWTTSASVAVRTSGTQSSVDLALSEANFLGTGAVAALGYVNDPDRSSILLAVDAPRVIRHRIGVGASYLDRSDGRAASLSVRFPFVSLVSRAGASLSAQFFDGRVLRFAGGRQTAVDSLRRRFEIVRGEVAWASTASRRGYVRIGLAGQIRRDDFTPQAFPDPVPRTVTAASGPFVSVRRPRFIVVRNVNTVGRVEDVELGVQLRGSLLAAPRAWGYERDGVGASVGIVLGQRIPSGFAFLQAGANALRTGAGTDSATAHASTTVVLQRTDRHLFVGYASIGALKNPQPGAEFDLGLGYLLRAFPAHSFTGDRYYSLTGEYRWLIWPRLLGLVGVGVAAFADHAGAWFQGFPRRTGSEAGAGLRFASIREAGTVWRLDLSRRLAHDTNRAAWVVSLGRGFVFQTP